MAEAEASHQKCLKVEAGTNTIYKIFLKYPVMYVPLLRKVDVPLSNLMGSPEIVRLHGHRLASCGSQTKARQRVDVKNGQAQGFKMPYVGTRVGKFMPVAGINRFLPW